MPTRRRILLSLPCGCAAHLALTGYAFPVNKTRADGNDAATAIGCGFDDANSDILTSQVENSSGVRDIDSRVILEIAYLNSIFHAKPEFNYFTESSDAQAKALRPKNDGGSTRVFLGVELCKRISAKGEGWPSVLVGVLGHEWAHVFQYRTSFQERRYMWETHADFLAGWSLALRAAAQRDLNISPFSDFLLNTKSNSTGYFSEDLYGTPLQRSRAAVAGFEYGSTRAGKYADEWSAAEIGYKYILESQRG